MAETFVDPVCGKEVTPETAADKLEYGAQTYYFDSPGCRTIFEMNPEKYTNTITNPAVNPKNDNPS